MLGYDASYQALSSYQPRNGHPRGLVDLENFDPRYGMIVPSPTAVARAIGGWFVLDRSV